MYVLFCLLFAKNGAEHLELKSSQPRLISSIHSEGKSWNEEIFAFLSLISDFFLRAKSHLVDTLRNQSDFTKDTKQPHFSI